MDDVLNKLPVFVQIQTQIRQMSQIGQLFALILENFTRDKKNTQMSFVIFVTNSIILFRFIFSGFSFASPVSVCWSMYVYFRIFPHLLHGYFVLQHIIVDEMIVSLDVCCDNHWTQLIYLMRSLLPSTSMDDYKGQIGGHKPAEWRSSNIVSGKASTSQEKTGFHDRV